MNKQVALYARVSSEQQVQAHTIDSQIAALKERIVSDGFILLNELQFIDEGYSGSNLVRPALERLRDIVALGTVDKVYVHSPDRLARKYAYQVLLVDEFHQAGTEIIFLNHKLDATPESNLLLQMQGMIAEYERAKIMERHRRGKLHAAKRGSINVLSTAPYGYKYIDKYTGCGQASLKIYEDEAVVVRKIFTWLGKDRLSIGEICRRLNQEKKITRTGKLIWDRSVIWGILKNPVYKGKAAFGKTRIGPTRTRLRPIRGSSEQPKQAYSIYKVPKEEWIMIPTPALIDEDLFETAQEQLEENRKQARTRKRGAKYLLQGLLVCKQCHYSYYGKPVRNKRKEKIDKYAYYRCIGTDAYRFGGERICNNKQIRTDTLEAAVWEEVKNLLQNPHCLEEEYQRRLTELQQSPIKQEQMILEKQAKKLQQGIARLIDSYTEGYIEKLEFEPRIKTMKTRLNMVKQQQNELLHKRFLQTELRVIIGHLQKFGDNVKHNLDEADWLMKRDIIRALVKRIEIDNDSVNVVFKVNALPEVLDQKMLKKNENSTCLQHCWWSKTSYYGDVY